MTDLRELCDGIGGRPTGSAACDRAIEWAAKKFRDIGIQNVSVEPFQAPSMWLPVSAEASAVSPATFNIRIAAAPMSPSTKGPIEARIIDAGEGTPEDFAKLGGAVRGAILLVHSSEMKTFDDLFAEYMRNAVLNDAVRKHQPVAHAARIHAAARVAVPASYFARSQLRSGAHGDHFPRTCRAAGAPRGKR